MDTTEYFPLLTGNLSLDLINTEVVRWGTRHNLLISEDEMRLWLRLMKENGALSDSQIPGDIHMNAQEIWQEAQTLRAFLREGFEQIIDQGEPRLDWIRNLELIVEKAPFSYKVVGGKLISVPMGKPREAFASLTAFDALQLVTEGKYKALRRCSNDECVLLFLDFSGRRKWCSMKICGNRAKVTRHNQGKKRKLED